MNRSRHAMPWVAFCAFVAIIAGLVVAVASPAAADAQELTGASLSLHVSEPAADQQFRTAALALDPGLSRLAALGATLTFDSADVTVSSCAVSEVGACNVRNGEVLISVFNLASLRANDQLLTINFEPTASAAATTTFGVAATTAVNNRGDNVGAVDGDSIEVEISAATFGSLTGTVVAAETATALFGIDVCAISETPGIETCTTSTGLGNWRIDDLATGTYGIVAVDETKVYTTTVASGFVSPNEVSFVAELAMAYFTFPLEDEADGGIDDDEATIALDISEDEPSDDASVQEAIVVVYEASIAGRVTGLETEVGVAHAQVCATQPFVLHQSCATTDADGVFALAGLSTGNYWVEAVDPLGRFEQVRPKLVGVYSDEATRTGVDIIMRGIEE